MYFAAHGNAAGALSSGRAPLSSLPPSCCGSCRHSGLSTVRVPDGRGQQHKPACRRGKLYRTGFLASGLWQLEGRRRDVHRPDRERRMWSEPSAYCTALPRWPRTARRYWANLAVDFTGLTAFSFMLFNLLCAPCFAAMGAIKREMNSAKWTWAAIGYLCVFAYVITLIVYQLGALFTGKGFEIGTAAAIILLAGLVYLLLRKNKYNDSGVIVSKEKVTVNV